MRKNVFAGSMLLLACVALVACTTDSGEEVQYVKIGQSAARNRREGLSGGVDGRNGCLLGEGGTYR